jgi:hypothetical protein
MLRQGFAILYFFRGDDVRHLRIGLAAVLCSFVCFVQPVACAAMSDPKICEKVSGDEAIAACTRAISSGREKGHALSVDYNNRGVEYLHKPQ